MKRNFIIAQGLSLFLLLYYFYSGTHLGNLDNRVGGRKEIFSL